MSLTLLVGLARLRDQGADRVELKYAGEGDSGGLDTIQAYCGDAAVPVPDAVYNLLEQWVVGIWHQRGWENNEGAYGTITIDLATLNVTVEHVDRYEENAQKTTYDVAVPQSNPLWQVVGNLRYSYSYYGGDWWVSNDHDTVTGEVELALVAQLDPLNLRDGSGDVVLDREVHTLHIRHWVSQTVDADVQVFHHEIES